MPFSEAAGTPAPHEVEDRLLVDALKQLAPDVDRTGVKILLEPLEKKATHYMEPAGARCPNHRAIRQPIRTIAERFLPHADGGADIVDALTRYGKYTGYVHLPTA